MADNHGYADVNKPEGLKKAVRDMLAEQDANDAEGIPRSEPRGWKTEIRKPEKK